MSKNYIMHIDTGRTWRGGQNQVYLLMRGLKKHGFRQLLVAPEGSPLVQKISELDIPVKNLDPINDFDLISALKLRKLMKIEWPDMVHFHTAKGLGMGFWLPRKWNVKKVFTRRVDFPVSGNFLNMLKYRCPDCVVVISEFIKGQMLDLGLKDVEKIYSTVDTDKFTGYKRDKTDNLKIAMAGAFDLYHKDFITFIKAVEHLKNSCRKQVKFYIAGSGKDEKKIKDLIKSAELQDRVEVVGFVNDMPDFLSSLDILVHTVNFEGLGTIILQAMAAGLPVAATDTGGISEIIEDKVSGFLVKKNDPVDTAEKILKLIEDDALRKSFGMEGRKRAETMFSSENMVQKYMKLYDRLENSEAQ